MTRSATAGSVLAVGQGRSFERELAEFPRWRPEVVFDAAALQHLTMLEQYPNGAWKTPSGLD